MSSQAVYLLNDYILNGTPVGPLLGYTGTGLRPIVPLQQQPEMNEQNRLHPYMAYSYRTSPDPLQWWMMMDEVTYVVWGQKVDDVNEVAGAMLNYFRRLDESAVDLMDYLRAKGDHRYQFHYVRVVNFFSPEPATAEAGRVGLPITLRYEYNSTAGIGIK